MEDTLSERARDRLAALLGDGRPRRALSGDEDECPTEVEPARSDEQPALDPTAECDDARRPAPARPRTTAPSSGGAEGLVERIRSEVTRRHVAVVAGLLLVACLGGGWAVLGARATPVPAVTASPVPGMTAAPAGGAGTASPASSPTPSTPPQVTVHVAGAVHRPGLVTLPEGSRVADAIAAAGGLLPEADPGELNLAEPLTDGSQVLIGTRSAPAGEVRGGGAGSGAGGGGTGSAGPGKGESKLDLNKATATQFEQLPGVGPVTAQRIVAWRDAHGRFSKVDELQEVDGIGPKTYGQLKDLVRV